MVRAVLLLASALACGFCVTVSTGCAARATLPDGSAIELDTRGNPQAQQQTGNSTVVNEGFGPDEWPYRHLRGIAAAWNLGHFAKAVRMAIDLSREMNRRQSAGGADIRQEDPRVGEVLRNAREAGLD